MHDPAPWRVGDVVFDLYRVDGVVGRGGMGLVYLVHHLGWAVDLAVKSPRLELFADDAAQQRFITEAQTWVSLGLHAHVCGCHYVRVLDGVPRLFAEYVEGGTLREWIDNRQLYRGSPAELLARVLDVAIQIAWGLVYAHGRGVVHQDVKPGNVLLGADGTVRITDFGLARARAAVREAHLGDPAESILVTVGGMTFAYASPEQVARQPVGRRSDMFSFAVTVLELFTGGVTWLAGPAAGAALADHLRRGPMDRGLPRMPVLLARMLQRCLRDDPAERFASMAEVATILLRIYNQALGVPYPRPEPRLAGVRADELNNRGVSLLDLGQVNEAHAAFDEALAIDPQHAYTIYNAGLPRWRAATLTDKALLDQLETARVVPGDGDSAAYPLALVHLERGDVEVAVALLEETALHTPGHPEITGLLRLANECRTRAGREVRRFTAQREGEPDTRHPLRHVSLTPDGRRALTASYWGRVCTWDVDSGHQLATVDVNPGDASRTPMVTGAAFSPDGRLVLLGHYDGTVRVYDLSGARDPITLKEPSAAGQSRDTYLRSACFTPDGSRVLIGRPANGVELWETGSGKRVAVVDDFEARYEHEQFRMRSGQRDRLGPLAGKRPFQRLVARVRKRAPGSHYSRDRPRSVNFVCLSPDGRQALVLDVHDGWLWDLANGDVRFLSKAPYPSTLGGGTGCFSPDGRCVLVTHSGGALSLFDLASLRRLQTFYGHTGTVTSVCFSPDGRRILTGSEDGTARLWDPGTERCLRTFTGHTHGVTSVCFSPDGRRILTGSEDGTARLWDLPRVDISCPALLCRPRPHAELADAETRAVTLLREAEQAMQRRRYPPALTALAAARTIPGHERALPLVQAWRQVSIGCTRIGCRGAWRVGGFRGGHGESITFWEGSHGAGSADSFSASAWSMVYGVIKRYDIDFNGGSRTTEFRPRSEKPYSPDIRCVNDDGFALLRARELVELWELPQAPPGRCVRRLAVSASAPWIASVCFGPGGRHALTGGADGSVRLWDLATGDCVRVLGGHRDWVIHVCLSQNGRYAVTASNDALLLQDLAVGHNGCPAWNLGRGYGVTNICFSPNGRDFATVSRRAAPELWSLADPGSPAIDPGRRHSLVGHTNEVTTGCFSPDGRFYLTGSRDQTIRLWDVGTGCCVHTIPAGGPVRVVRFSPDGAFALASVGITIQVWALDWDLEARQPAGWADAAAPYLDAFLAQHTWHNPASGGSANPTGRDIRWTEAEWAKLLRQLRYAGFGWLDPDGVHAQLARMARERAASPNA
jgi:WD40 repeat protein/serine/threonine protein kinase